MADEEDLESKVFPYIYRMRKQLLKESMITFVVVANLTHMNIKHEKLS